MDKINSRLWTSLVTRPEQTTDKKMEPRTDGGPWIPGLTYVNMVNIAKSIDDCQNEDKKDFSFHLFFWLFSVQLMRNLFISF